MTLKKIIPPLTLLVSFGVVSPVFAQSSFSDLIKQGLDKALRETQSERGGQGTSTDPRTDPSNAQAAKLVVDKGCNPESVKMDVDILDVHLGEADCSPVLMKMQAPGFVMKDLAPAEPRMFGPAQRSVAEHVSNARELIASQPRVAGEKAYTQSTLHLGGVQSVPEEYQGLYVHFILLKARVDAPKALIWRIDRQVCAPNQEGVDVGSALYKGYVTKYGEPAEVVTFAGDLKNAQANFARAESIFNAKVKEDSRYAQVLRDSLVSEQNKLNRAKSLAASRPNGVRGLAWNLPNNTKVIVYNEGGATCPGQFPLVTSQLFTNGFEDVMKKADAAYEGLPKPQVSIPRL